VRALVTGAGGFLGARVVSALLERGHAVRALLRPAAAEAPAQWRGRAEIVRADLRAPSALEKLFDGVDVLVHLAACMGGTPEAQFAGTVVGTENLLQGMCRAQSARRIVLASSLSVYDWTAANGRLSEESPLEARPYERDGYAVAKLWQERVVRRLASENRWTLTVLRPGVIYGPGASASAGAVGAIDLGAVCLVVGPFAHLPLTHVENCAAAFADAAENAAEGTFNIVDDERISAWRYTGRLYGSARRVLRLPLPYRVGLAIAHAAEAASRVLFPPKGGKLPGILIPRRYRARFKPLRIDNRRAKEMLGWKCRPLFATGCAVK
jgi:nucleoside-diphosphate-sugar epimerase